MPTYEYACTLCAYQWECEQSIKEAALTQCPSCGKEAARRQISRGTGFILKGSGWYSDLYSSASNKPPAQPEGGSAVSSGSESKGSDSGSGTKTDAGSSAKAEGGSSKKDSGSSTASAA